MIVIDLTIEDNQDALILVEDRLLTAGYINDRQATHAQCNSIFDPDSLIVWPAMANYLAHMIYELLRASVTALQIDKTSYSAHDRISLCDPMKPATPVTRQVSR